VSGERPLHGCVLAGRTADGELGFIKHEYWLRAGQIVNEREEYFAAGRKITIFAGEPIRHLAQDPATWTDGPVRVVRRFMAALKAANPHIGGPDQIVLLDRGGARWLSRPEAFAESPSVDTASVIAASVEMQSAKLTLNLNGVTTSIANIWDASYGAYAGLVVQSNTYPSRTLISYAGLAVLNSGGNRAAEFSAPSDTGYIPRILPIQTFEIMRFLKDVSHNDPQFYHNDIEMKFFSFISLFSAHYLQFGLMFSLILLQLVLLIFELNQQLFENIPPIVWLMVLGLPFLIVVAVSCFNYYEIRRPEKKPDE
jgi:hypothetical protein